MRLTRLFLLLLLVLIGGGFARLLAQSGQTRPSGAPVAGYTLVTDVSLGASNYCPLPGDTIQFVATVSGEGDAGATVKVKIKTEAGVEITSCDAIPGGGCTASYTVPDTPGTVRVTASATGTQGGTRTSSPVTDIVVQRKQWRAEPVLVPGTLSPKRQTPGQQTPPPPADPQPGEEPPAETPLFVAPQGQRRFAPGSTVKLTVVEAEDKDTCSRCSVDQEPVADVIKYLWTQGGEGTTEAITVTMPATQGETIEVAVNVDDEADLSGDGGTRDDEAAALTMTLYAAYPDPNDPDDDVDGLPNSMDDDDDGDGDPDITDPDWQPPTTPPAPAPQAIGLTATAQNATTIQLNWSGAAGTLYSSTEPDFTADTNTRIPRGADENDATQTSYTHQGLTPETTYYYILVPNGNADLTQGSASATTPASTAITLTATADDATTIELSWSGAAGTLYSSTQENFTADTNTRIPRGDAENDAAVTSYTHQGLTPETTYYYILVPNGNADLTQGEANATTPDLERSAQASFLLLKSNGEEAGDTIGGTVTVVLELELENAEAGSENAVVRIQETGTEGEVTHDEDEDHIDFSLDLTSEAGWQQWLDPDGEGPQVASWQAATSAPVGTGKWRWSTTWNTAGLPLSSGQAGTPQYSKLLNHNGEHLISLAQVDGGEGGTLEFGDESADVEDKNVEVGNLVITEVSTGDGNEDYFKFESQSDAFGAPTINFTIADDGDPHQYKWRVRIRSTDKDNDWSDSVLVSGTAQNPDTIEVKVNDPGEGQTQVNDMSSNPETDATAYAPIQEWGTYTFDISVQEVDENGQPLGDSMSYRSQKLRIPQQMPDGTERGHGGQFTTTTNGAESYAVHYFFHDTSNPALPAGTEVSSMKIEMLPPDLGEPIASSDDSWGKTLEEGYFNKHLHTFAAGTRPLGIIITLFMAEDTHAAEYRDHRNKRSLVKNDREGFTLGQLTFEPSDKKIALDDCSIPAKGLNQYVITAGMPTSITLSNPDYVGLTWLQQNSSWSLAGGPPLRAVASTRLSILGGYVGPEHAPQTFVTPQPLPGPASPPPPAPPAGPLTPGFEFQVKRGDFPPSATSNQGWIFPSSNSDFGVKTFTHTVAGVNTTAPVALFYPAAGFQHPHGGPRGYYYGSTGTWAEVSTPNWLYYYNQAWPAPCEVRYLQNNTPSNSKYYNGNSFIWVGDDAHGTKGTNTYLFGRVRAANGTLGPLQMVGQRQLKGIDTYAAIVTHENTHKLSWEYINNGGYADADGDMVPDDWERQAGLDPDDTDSTDWTTNPTVTGEFGNAYDASQGDDEVFARMHERVATADIDKDWADDGLNFGRPLSIASIPSRCKRYFDFPEAGVNADMSNVEWPSLP